jgi:iron-sulfur cluster assembly accessory protein
MKDPGLRIRIAGGGCSGFTYEMEVEDGADDGDQVVEAFGVKLFVDGKSGLYLGSTEIDYEEGIMQSGFRFHNPNATGTCGCGESFAV